MKYVSSLYSVLFDSIPSRIWQNYSVHTQRASLLITAIHNSYIAHCPDDDCKSFKGDEGNVWVKISQQSYDPSAQVPWASDLLREQGALWKVTVPPTLAPGEYLLRHEILGLHVAGTRMGAQFYPSCTQIRVIEGGDTQLPVGVALPGAYDPDDTAGVSPWLLVVISLAFRRKIADCWAR